MGGAKSKETWPTTVTVGFDRILQLNSPTFANKEAYLQNVALLVVGSYQTHCKSTVPCFLAFCTPIQQITVSIEKFFKFTCVLE